MSQQVYSEFMKTPRGRVSYPHVFKAKAAEEGQKPKYSMTLIFDIEEMKKDPAELAKYKALKDAVDAMIKEKWPKGAPRNFKNPFKKGEEKLTSEGESVDGYEEGKIYIATSAQADRKPQIVDDGRTGTVKMIEEPNDFYPGCYAIAKVRAYSWGPNAGGVGISFGVVSAQKVADGEPLGGAGGGNALDDFQPIAAPELSEGSAGNNDEDLFGNL